MLICHGQAEGGHLFLGILWRGQELLNILHHTGQPPPKQRVIPTPPPAGLLRVRTLVCAGEETEARRSSQVVSGDVPGPEPGFTWCTAMPSTALSALAGGLVQSPTKGFYSLSKACFAAYIKGTEDADSQGEDQTAGGRSSWQGRAPAGGELPWEWGSRLGMASSFSRKTRNLTLPPKRSQLSV